MFVALRQLKERAPGSSFDFYCRDAANGLSSSEVTKLVGSILRLRLNMASKNERLIDHGNALQNGGGGANIMRMPVQQRAEVFDEIVHPQQRILRQCTAPLVVSPHQHFSLDLDSSAHLTTPFVELLEPLGLVGKYCRAFAESGIHFEVPVKPT